MTDFELGQKFATVIISFRPFWHLLSISDQILPVLTVFIAIYKRMASLHSTYFR